MNGPGLGRLWGAWKHVAHRLGAAQTWAGLTLIYWGLAVPLGALVRAFSDPLDLRGPGGWRRRQPSPRQPSAAGRQS